MGGKSDKKGGSRSERLAAELRANLRRRKAQARARDDLSGLDPNRTDTPLNRPKDNENDDVDQ